MLIPAPGLVFLIFAEYGLGDVPDAKVRIARFEELLKIADK